MQEKQANTYILHRTLAVILDIAIVFLFVALGKKEHGASYGFDDYLQIALPFLVAFFGVQLALGKDQRSVKWGAIAAVISIPIAIFIRINMPQVVGRDPYEFKPAFFIISLIFLTAGWSLWRFILGKLRPQKS